MVRLPHSDVFAQDELWRYAADFKTNAGKQLGIKLTRRAPGVGDLEVYFDPAVAMEEKTGESPKSEIRNPRQIRNSKPGKKGCGATASAFGFQAWLSRCC